MSDTDRDNEQQIEISDMSGGMQEKTSEYQVKINELGVAYNSRYDTVGGIKKAVGYTQQGNKLTSTTTTSTSTSTTTTSTSTSSSTSSSTSTSTTLPLTTSTSITTTSTSTTSTSTTTSSSSSSSTSTSTTSTSSSTSTTSTSSSSSTSITTSTSTTLVNGFIVEKTITIDHTKVGTSDSTNFPILFSGTYSYLKTTGNGGNVTNANGYDIVFCSDSGLTTKLSFERVSWDATTGACEFWIKIPTLSHTSDTIIYLGVGKSSITTDQQDQNGTWNTNFHFVYHGETNLTESTSNANILTNHNTTDTAGWLGIGRARAFDPTGPQYITAPDSASLSVGGSNHTISFWMNLTDCPIYRGAVCKRGSSVEYNYAIGDGGGNKYQESYNGSTEVLSTSQVTTGTWHLCHIVFDGSNRIFYLDGSANGSSAQGAAGGSGNIFNIGRDNGGTSYNMNGSLDEIRVIATNISADWITAEWNNQNNPSTFYTIT